VSEWRVFREDGNWIAQNTSVARWRKEFATWDKAMAWTRFVDQLRTLGMELEKELKRRSPDTGSSPSPLT